MLVGAALSGITSFIFSTYTRVSSIRTQLAQLKAECDNIQTESTPLIAGKCIGAFGQLGGQPLTSDFVSRNLLGHKLDDYNQGKEYGVWVKSQRVDYFENFYLALVLAGIGFVAGFALWLLYRLIRFAVQG